MKIGYFLSSEEWGPRDLVQLAIKAQRAGFEDLWISDHYHPWNDEQGHSPFVWSVIGAIAQATDHKVTTAEKPPPILVSGFGPKAIEVAARIGDGFVTVGPDADAVKRFRDGRTGRDGLVQGGIKVCWAADEAQARKTAHRLWANDGLPGELAQVLPTPQHFEQASQLVTEEMIAEATPCGPDFERHVQAIEEYADAGFDEVYVQQIGPEQDLSFEAYREHVIPRFK
jgi:G6PDH family F420-dependent oxidoreductase